MNVSNKEKENYLKRSYSAVDGLWFMMVEEEFGFEKALEFDQKVWSVMPKIQARFLKNSLGSGNGLEGLKICYSEKMRLDGFEFEVESKDNSFTVNITACPWHETMVTSGREHLSSKIGETICTVEYSGWAKEFGENIKAEITDRICTGNKTCVVKFRERANTD